MQAKCALDASTAKEDWCGNGFGFCCCSAHHNGSSDLLQDATGCRSYRRLQSARAASNAAAHVWMCSFPRALAAATHACMKIQPSTLEDVIAPFKSLPSQQLKNIIVCAPHTFQEHMLESVGCLLDWRGWYRQGGKVCHVNQMAVTRFVSYILKMFVACVLELVEIVLPATAHSSASMLECRAAVRVA